MSNLTARERDILSCHVCSRLAEQGERRCRRCNASLHLRKPQSLQRAGALLVTSALLYIPAMLLPVSTVYALGAAQESTLMGSVIHFIEAGSWPIGLVIFFASVAIPIVKILGLGYLLIGVHTRASRNRLQRARLYQIIEFVGRWSMIDVFVIAILVALVQIGVFINIVAGAGIFAFTCVVIFTMLAAMSFDPRLIWDE